MTDPPPDRLARELDRACGAIAARFGRRDLRDRALRYLRALAGGRADPGDGRRGRFNGSGSAAAAGDAGPHDARHFPSRAKWDADAVRDDARGYAVDRLTDPADPGAAALIAGTAWFPKRGTRSAGAARGRSPDAGRLETGQTAAFPAYRTGLGCALIDREPVLPPHRAGDAARRAAKGTAPGLRTAGRAAKGMIRRAAAAGAPRSWVAADRECGSMPGRVESGGRRVPSVARYSHPDVPAGGPADVPRLDERLEDARWEGRPCGGPAAERGPCLWAAVPAGGRRKDRTPLVRNRRRRPSGRDDRRTVFLCDAPDGTPVRHPATVAGLLGELTDAVGAAKREVGLGDYEVRGSEAWRRHVTLAALAHAVRVAAAAPDDV